MLSVPTYVAPSRISGVGLFTPRPLPAGITIWEFTEAVDWRISPEELERFPESYRSRLHHYLYLEESGLYVLCGDNAKFMNHAEQPNCVDTDERFTVTGRRIEADEELTCDYRAFDHESVAKGARGPAGRLPSLDPPGPRPQG